MKLLYNYKPDFIVPFPDLWRNLGKALQVPIATLVSIATFGLSSFSAWTRLLFKPGSFWNISVWQAETGPEPDVRQPDMPRSCTAMVHTQTDLTWREFWPFNTEQCRLGVNLVLCRLVLHHQTEQTHMALWHFHIGCLFQVLFYRPRGSVCGRALQISCE